MTEKGTKKTLPAKHKPTGDSKADKGFKLSVVVPCYKVEKYLPRCLDSLLSQSLTELEIVCINDGSPDNCLSILKTYKEKYGERIVIIDKQNEGVWKARLDGIQASHGEYIGFLDSDDYVKPGYAKKLYELAYKFDADIACCGYDRIDEPTGKLYSREMTRFKYRSFDIQKNPGLLLEVNTAPWNKIFRASLLKGMQSLDHIPPALDDMMFAQLIYLNAGLITFIPDPLICYMVRSDSIINNINPSLVPDIYRSMKELRSVFVRRNRKLLPYLDALAFLHLGISLMYRLYRPGKKDFYRLLSRNTMVLDRAFPLWRRNRYIKLRYTLSHKGSNLKLLTVRFFYAIRLFPAFLFIYTAMIKYLKIDMKW
ncbi:MAG: glycosyltransferase family 2 protein [Eubacterium sp.]|nr:glycosyltransferase family 2 protein [Eubacterium sp.]